MTTPGACEIHSALKEGLKNGAKAAVIETSSHALSQYRVAHVNYNTAVFTNLTPEHLNYHKTVEAYFNAKVKLFEQLSKSNKGVAVVNSDCEYGEKLIGICSNLNLKVFSYGKNKNDSIRILEFNQQLGKSKLMLEFKNNSYKIETNLIGSYNGYNIAAAFGVLVANDFNPLDSAFALSDIPCVPGRLEFVGTKDIGVFVDYAHTGDGLENVLSALKPFAKNNLWVLFGCGGGKDKGKRIAMGNAAKKIADKIVLTNDNPKLEEPEKIIEDILQSGCSPEFIELDRGKAIEKTLNSVKKGDVVVLAGKGHEDYQIIGTKTIPFSDREEVLKWKNK
jgi:UDP-N-acetylmuramoyl-L-alanyl-D-glutamate--2,6-diaminopimelate ligase